MRTRWTHSDFVQIEQTRHCCLHHRWYSSSQVRDDPIPDVMRNDFAQENQLPGYSGGEAQVHVSGMRNAAHTPLATIIGRDGGDLRWRIKEATRQMRQLSDDRN